MLKMIGELIQTANWKEYWILMVVMVVFLGVSGTLQLHELNLAMKFYD